LNEKEIEIIQNLIEKLNLEKALEKEQKIIYIDKNICR